MLPEWFSWSTCSNDASSETVDEKGAITMVKKESIASDDNEGRKLWFCLLFKRLGASKAVCCWVDSEPLALLYRFPWATGTTHTIESEEDLCTIMNDPLLPPLKTRGLCGWHDDKLRVFEPRNYLLCRSSRVTVPMWMFACRRDYSESFMHISCQRIESVGPVMLEDEDLHTRECNPSWGTIIKT